MDWRHTVELLAAGSQVYSELKNISVWVKNNAGMGSLYRSQHEFVLVYKSGTAPHTNNIALGKYGRHRTNVCYDGASTQARKGDDLLSLHPTAKPVHLVMDAILDCSNRGDLVLDSFLGSGTTLLAAERTGAFGTPSNSIHFMSIPPYGDGRISPDKMPGAFRTIKRFGKLRPRWSRLMTDKSKSRGYEVGYGKPPVSGRFRKGSSGNPSGRPKMLPTKVDPGSVLEAIDSEEVIVIDNGKRRRMLKARVYFRQLMTRAIKGDLKAARLVSAWPPSTSRRRCSPLDESSASVSLKHKVGMVGIGKNTFDILDEPT